MRAEHLAAACALLATTLAGTPASAFCRTTTPEFTITDPETGCNLGSPAVYWKSQCVTYRVDESAPELDPILRQAFALWTNPGSQCLPSISAVALGPTDRDTVLDRENVVLFRDTNWASSAQALAITTVSMDVDTGEILDADLEINTQDFTFTPGQLRYVVTHEVGHFLGLDHSQEADAIMNASYDMNGDTLPRLSEDDAAGVCSIYLEDGDRVSIDAMGAPARVAATPCPPFAVDPDSGACGPAVVENGCSLGASRNAGSGTAALLLGVALALRVRRRRRA